MIKEKEDGRIEGWRKRKKEDREGEIGREVWSREKEEENVCGRNYVISYIVAVNLESNLYIYNSNSFILPFLVWRWSLNRKPFNIQPFCGTECH